MHGHGHGYGSDKKTTRKSPHGKILGTTTVGERGQVVIPAEARTEMDISSGDKLVVFGNSHNDTITFVKADIFDRYADFFMSKSKKLEKLAEEILRATQDDADTEEDTEGTGEASPEAPDEKGSTDAPETAQDFVEAKREKLSSDDA